MSHQEGSGDQRPGAVHSQRLQGERPGGAGACAGGNGKLGGCGLLVVVEVW